MRRRTLVRVAAGGLGAWAVVRAAGLEGGGLLVIPVSFTPYVVPPGAIVTAAAVRLRCWGAAAVAGASTAALAAAVLPRAVRQPPPALGDAVPLRVGVANLLIGGATASAVVRLVSEQRVDVLVTPELTPAAVRRLFAAGLDWLLPHHVLAPAPGGWGNGVWARWPLRPCGDLAGSPVGPWVEMAVPGAGAVEVVAAHPPPPKPRRIPSGEWAAGVRALPPPADGGRRIVAGDLNATLDHAVLREALSPGWVDAAAAVGAGLRPTWAPLPSRWSPAVVAIDHVLVGPGVAVRGVEFRRLAASDHRAVIAHLMLRREPALAARPGDRELDQRRARPNR